MLKITLSPPVTDASFGVKRRAFTIKRMADLMADHRADGAIVKGRRSFWIVERRLQDGCGEIESILQRQIDGVHRLRGHGPLLAVHIAAQPGDLAMIVD